MIAVGGRNPVHGGQLVRQEINQRGLGGKDGVEEVCVMEAVCFGHQPDRLRVSLKGRHASAQYLEAHFHLVHGEWLAVNGPRLRVEEAEEGDGAVDLHLVELSFPTQAAVVEADAGVKFGDGSHRSDCSTARQPTQMGRV